MKKYTSPQLTLCIALASTVVIPFTHACTGITLHADDGAVIPGRTMEFGFDIESRLGIVPAGTEIHSLSTAKGDEGFRYKTKFGFVGMNGVGMPIVLDGLNEKGLYFGAHYFVGEAKFADINDENNAKAIGSADLGNWLLGNFATVDEVREALPAQVVVESYIKQIKGNAPIHYILTDASGKSIVIEYTSDGLKIFDNKVRAFANSPSFDWHLKNLVNYIGLTPNNREAIELNGEEIVPFGEGTGLVGLPGDSTSPSRFVRAAVFANMAAPSKTAEDGVFQAFHILNIFDLPKGAIRSEEEGHTLMEYTLWSSATDTKNLAYYFKTYESQSVEKVDLQKALENVTTVTYLPIESGFRVIDRTPSSADSN
ncbi:linear amide C-N hydrolase [Rubritalea spongiae]|uniref:Linear amide C-N hydrolase n=1 Tax=Rubritalea spongiae TaxID=430797 RepID=A0ABW5E632_9BACT